MMGQDAKLWPEARLWLVVIFLVGASAGLNSMLEKVVKSPADAWGPGALGTFFGLLVGLWIAIGDPYEWRIVTKDANGRVIHTTPWYEGSTGLGFGEAVKIVLLLAAFGWCIGSVGNAVFRTNFAGFSHLTAGAYMILATLGIMSDSPALVGAGALLNAAPLVFYTYYFGFGNLLEVLCNPYGVTAFLSCLAPIALWSKRHGLAAFLLVPCLTLQGMHAYKVAANALGIEVHMLPAGFLSFFLACVMAVTFVRKHHLWLWIALIPYVTAGVWLVYAWLDIALLHHIASFRPR